LNDEQIKYTSLTTDYAGSVNFSLTDAIRSTFSFGGQGAVTQLVRTTAYSQDFPGPSEPTVSGGATFIAREDRERVVNAGFFFQNMFNFNDKLFLTGGVRVDGNSTFGKGLGLQAYPKAQVSYVISDESFFPEGLGEMMGSHPLRWGPGVPPGQRGERRHRTGADPRDRSGRRLGVLRQPHFH
jgi:outer membrane receptor protein involved in Fe transport